MSRPAQASKRFVNGDARQPRPKWRTSGELPKMLIGAHIRRLHHVFSLCFVTDNRSGSPIQPLVIAPHDDLKERSFSTEHSRNNKLVGELLRAGTLLDVFDHKSLYFE